MYARMLVPLDGSEPAEAILPVVERIAGPLAEVLLLALVEPISVVSGLASAGVVGPDALLLRQVELKRYLAEVATRLEAKGVRVRTALGLGAPAAEILEVARTQHADLIAMATRGRGGLGRVAFGSVAETVLRAAPVPVLMIRMTARLAEPREASAP